MLTWLLGLRKERLFTKIFSFDIIGLVYDLGHIIWIHVSDGALRLYTGAVLTLFLFHKACFK